MLILLVLFCANPDLESARTEFLVAAKAKADSITDAPAAERIRKEMEAFLADDRKVPTSPHLLALRDKYIAKRALWRQRYLTSLPESERAAQEASWEKQDELPPLLNRTKWVRKAGGYFAVMQGKDWGEYNAKGVAQFRWQEEGRTPEYVELTSKRPGTEYTIRLYEGHSYIRLGPKSTVWECGDGKWME
ncbi:MAG TPA: hypothetical protein VMP01_25135 [Pirellulaceae bacterium]|nr:hypothetical protein [Pirellulaceae bacterium]